MNTIPVEQIETINFENFYIYLLEKHDEKFTSLLREYGDFLEDGEKIKSDIYFSIIHELNSISFRVLLYEFYVYKEMYRINESSHNNDIYYNRFNNYCHTDEFMQKLKSNYPYLVKLIYDRIDFRLQNIHCLLQHFVEDLPNIISCFHMEVNKINHIQFGLGDSHNKGKNVIFVETNAGSLVYKPHNLNNDFLFNSVLSMVCKGIDVALPTVKTVSKQDRGWQTFMETKGFQSVKEAQNYYRNIGILLAVFYVLRTDDIHYENIIMDGEIPYVLDLETIIANKSPVSNEEDTLFEQFHNEINESVIGSCVLPMNLKFSPFDVDLSVIGNEKEVSNRWKSFFIENHKTDAIQLVRKPSPIEKDQVVAKIGESVVHPYDYVTNLKYGFKASYRFLLNHKNELFELLNQYAEENITTRQVLRATNLYTKMLSAITHPVYIRSIDNVIRVFSKLYETEDTSSAEKKIRTKTDHEIEALLRHDVPYFTQEINSHSLQANQTEEVANYFHTTPLRVVQNKLEKMGQKDLDKQLDYIDLSIQTLYQKPVKAEKDELDSTSYIYNLLNVKMRLNWELKHTIKQGDLATWAVHEVNSENKIEIAPLSYSLYDSLGFLINLLSLYNLTNESKYLSYAKKGLQGVLTTYPAEELIESNLISLFNGVGGYLYTLSMFYSTTGDSYYKYLMRIYTKKMINHGKFMEEMDYTSGLSGIIFLFYRLYKKYKMSLYKEASIHFGKQLTTNFQGNLAALNGMAHGYSGFSQAFAALYDLTNNEQLLYNTMAAVYNENKNFNKNIRNWADLRSGHEGTDTVFWCHGAPGICLARMNVLQILNGRENNEFQEVLQRDFHTALKKTMNDGFNVHLNDSLCHGKIGNLDILIEVNQYLKCQELTKFIQQRIRSLKDNLRKGNYSSGTASSMPVKNFMLGLHGLDYALMRMNNPNLPSILNLSL